MSNKKQSHIKKTSAKITNSVPVKEHESKANTTINKYYIYSIIVLFSFILYGNTIPNDYALDDAMVNTNNRFTQSGIHGIKDIFLYDSFKGFSEVMMNSVSGGRYRPLSIATFAIENHFFGNNPHISHFINICLYTLTCLLLYIILDLILKKHPQQNWYISIPFIATILFIAHPIHTEVVANIKCRDEIMSLLFSLFSLFLILKYFEHHKIIYLFSASFIYLLALLSKEIAIVFILIIPLTVFFFTDTPFNKIIQSLIPLIITAIGFIILRYVMISKTPINTGLIPNLLNDSFLGMNFSQRYATIIYTFGVYLKLIFFPHPLTWDYYPYHISIMEWSHPFVLISFLAMIFILVVGFKGLKNKDFLSYCIFLFLIPLSLILNILFLVGAFMGERFLYVSSIGFVLMIAYFMVIKPYPFLKTIFNKPLLFLIPVLLLYSFKTINRNKVWKDNFTIIETDIKTSSNSVKSNGIYGELLYRKAEAMSNQSDKEKLYENIIPYLEKSIKIVPDQPSVNFILGTLYGRYKHDFNKSIYYLNNAMILNPSDIDIYNNLGTAYGIKKQYDKAMEVFEKGLQVAPNDTTTLTNLAITCQNIGDTAKANYYAKKVSEIKKLKK